MKGYKQIGRGSFSTAYRKGNSKKVLISSRDDVKECMALGWFPSSRLFPSVTRLSYSTNGRSTYTMKYYDKIKAPKQQLNAKAYKLYRALKKLDIFCLNHHDLYEECIEKFRTLSNEFRTAKYALIKAVEALSNYGSDIQFEISPRNIAATPSGNLILLDCFFMSSALSS